MQEADQDDSERDTQEVGRNDIGAKKDIQKIVVDNKQQKVNKNR